MIFYLRCAAYLRLRPRTRTQIQRAQTHSRRRAMLAAVTKINLPSCLGFCFQICPFYMMAPRATHASNLWNILSHAQIYTEKRKNERNWLFTRPLTIYKKNCYTVASDGKMKLFLSFSPSVTKGKPFFFILSRVAYVSQILNSLLLVPNYPKQEFCQFHWLGYIKNR